MVGAGHLLTKSCIWYVQIIYHLFHLLSEDMIIYQLNTVFESQGWNELYYHILFLQMLQINNGSVEVDASIMGAQEDAKKVKVPLNSR